MPESKPRYVCLRVYYGDSDRPQFLCANGKLVVFDALEHAQTSLEAFGSGLRLPHWDAARETLFFSPLARTGFNRLELWTDYDPYDVPNGFRSLGIWSEGAGRAWRYHVMWHEVYQGILQWADDLNAREFAAPVVARAG